MAPEAPPRSRPPAIPALARRLRWPLVVALLAALVIVVVATWDDVGATLASLSPAALVGSQALVLAGLFLSALTWRVVLMELGSEVGIPSACRIYLLGQLAKYAPGSVWALPAQMELAAGVGVPRARALAASAVAIGINVVTGLALGLLAVPAAVGGSWALPGAIAALVVGAIVLSPPVLSRIVRGGLRVSRQAPLERRLGWRGMLVATGWSVLSWVAYGLSVWLVAVSVGAPAARSLAVSLGGVALAMTLGFLVVVVPSGIGVREGVLIAALGSVVAHPAAVAVSLVARLVFTLGDLIAAAGVAALVGVRRRRIGVSEPDVPPSGAPIEDVEALNDRLALEHSIDDYYARSPLPIRLVEQRRLAIIRELVGDARGLDVAEVGSGGGHVLRMFPESRLTAFDVSGVYLDIARKNLAGYDVRFVKGEVDKLDLPPASFDRIICSEVLEHVVDPEAIVAAIARLLRPRGIAVLTIPNDALIARLKRGIDAIPGWSAARFQWGGDSFHLHRWTDEEFSELIGRHLEITDRRTAPLARLPLRRCYRCVSKPARVLPRDRAADSVASA